MTNAIFRRNWLLLSTLLAIICSPHGVVAGFQLIPSNEPLGRREALGSAAALLSTLTVPTSASAADIVEKSELTKTVESINDDDDFKAYGIIPDASEALSPNLVALEV